jgi:hypothetical protein
MGRKINNRHRVSKKKFKDDFKFTVILPQPPRH